VTCGVFGLVLAVYVVTREPAAGTVDSARTA
jgi:hypothetical protein